MNVSSVWKWQWRCGQEVAAAFSLPPAPVAKSIAEEEEEETLAAAIFGFHQKRLGLRDFLLAMPFGVLSLARAGPLIAFNSFSLTSGKRCLSVCPRDQRDAPPKPILI
ncbi:hypothetical protein R1flu_001648 [Riccia fluitans]|uniref:Uncharacterized protein n=1 Tax=Riccia fluitans TaxID=41844 RepID=A0ABD1Y3V6_9MARC